MKPRPSISSVWLWLIGWLASSPIQDMMPFSTSTDIAGIGCDIVPSTSRTFLIKRLIDTPMTRSLDPEVYNMLEKSIPCKKAGKPADIAHTVAFLSSDEASFINGQVIHVDGGKSIGANVH